MTPETFFTLVEAELRRRRVPLDAGELLAFAESMWKLWDQERTPAAWAEAFLREQRRPVEVA
jgi:hypothetical protein